MQYDVIVVGAGIVGLATALQVKRSRPGLKLAVLEKDNAVALHQSSHNSGVIHSGIYYKPGSLRALNCLRGYRLLLDFCRENGVPFEVCGKIIVAALEHERPQLDTILQRGLANGLQGIRKIPAAEAREIEPHVNALEAIFVPQAGIINFGEAARTYARLLTEAGVDIFTGNKVDAIRQSPKKVVVETSLQTLEASLLITCAGLYSDRVARLEGFDPGVQIIPFRGEYYELVPERTHLVNNLIYPVPNPNFPFLGVHFTRMIEGGIEAGPNAVLAFRREGYSRSDVHAGELLETLLYPGFRKIARKYWRDGWEEMKRSYSKAHFLRALQKLVPEIRSEDLHPGRSGVRAMACDAQGNMLDDFLILEKERVIHVCNAPSPAATASLSIGLTLAEKVLNRF